MPCPMLRRWPTMDLQSMSINQDPARIRRRYEQMASGELVSALVRNRLSEENARVAREILWEREAHEAALNVEQRKLRRRLQHDEANNGWARGRVSAAETGPGRAGLLDLPRWAWWGLAMAIVLIVSIGLLY